MIRSLSAYKHMAMYLLNDLMVNSKVYRRLYNKTISNDVCGNEAYAPKLVAVAKGLKPTSSNRQIMFLTN